MALKECPECKGQVSNTATTCPHCGYTRETIGFGDFKISLPIVEKTPTEVANEKAKAKREFREKMRKKMKAYIVVDKEKKELISEHDTNQEAWSAMQDIVYETNQKEHKGLSTWSRFSSGKAKNMKKYIS